MLVGTDLLLFLNHLSFQRQFTATSVFLDSVDHLISMRNVARLHQREIFCPKLEDISNVPVNRDGSMTLISALNQFTNRDKCRSVISWINRMSWHEVRSHSHEYLMACRDEVVTNTTVGEAAYRSLIGDTSNLVSLKHTDWNLTPVTVNLEDADRDMHVELENFWESEVLDEELGNIPEQNPIARWQDLKKLENQFPKLTFTEDWIEPLRGFPFSQSSAERIKVLLEILNQLASEFDKFGVRTEKGHEIVKQFFRGDSLFSDSSDGEKQNFKNELTFAHPDKAAEPLFCPWHGKERSNTIRLHFSWPIRHDQPCYIVYVGQKLTRL